VPRVEMLDTSGGGAEAPPTGEVPAWMNNARSMGAAQAQTLKTVGSLVQDNPKQAALIVRDWLTSGA
jgi:flagellar M-ring protein FliF